jgi:hypothetical protein
MFFFFHWFSSINIEPSRGTFDMRFNNIIDSHQIWILIPSLIRRPCFHRWINVQRLFAHTSSQSGLDFASLPSAREERGARILHAAAGRARAWGHLPPDTLCLLRALRPPDPLQGTCCGCRHSHPPGRDRRGQGRVLVRPDRRPLPPIDPTGPLEVPAPASHRCKLWPRLWKLPRGGGGE